MLRLIGILLISVSLSLYGAYASARLAENAACRAELAELLFAVRTGIDHGALPLAEIYRSFSFRRLARIGFDRVLLAKPDASLADALEKAKPYLDGDVYELYADFASKLGKSGHVSAESALCDRYGALINEKEKSIRAREDVKRLLYRRLGLLAGLTAALILL